MLAVLAMGASQALAAGTLSARGDGYQPIRIRDHHVDVKINNGFAATEVTQTFFNPNDTDLEAVYAFPVPKSASLSEVTIYAGETEIHGEVLARQKAEKLYNEEKSKGGDAGLARKNQFYTFEFRVARVPAQDQTRIRFLYYQPLEIELGVGRYVYPLEEGGTDEAAQQFWATNAKVENTFSVNVELKSAWPVTKVRAPGFDSLLDVEQRDEGHYVVKFERQDASLERDFVFYYRLADNLPGRVELIPYKPAKDKPGTFMMVVTPGMDLKALTNGADYAFVLDVSGSMRGKIQTLARGVVKAMGQMRAHDRFRIITFNTSAKDLTNGWIAATPENVKAYAAKVEALHPSRGTNLYAGMKLALGKLDDDRATSIVLVTDAVTNTGMVDPKAFWTLLEKVDVRVFGFVMGNSGNWPLMRVISEASGGFAAGVSNQDDIVGQILLAKSKVTYECLHDAKLRVSGVKTHDTTDQAIGKVYRGQQLVLFGRYDTGGKATVTLDGRMTGQDKTYTTTFDFPDVDTSTPEIERLWALNRIERLEDLTNTGRLPASETATAIRDLGVQYQLVTDETAMVVLTDQAFAEHGVERRNQQRVATERQARARRTAQPVSSNRVDTARPMFSRPSPFSGGGAFDPLTAGLAVGAVVAAGAAARRRRRNRRGSQ